MADHDGVVLKSLASVEALTTLCKNVNLEPHEEARAPGARGGGGARRRAPRLSLIHI